MATSKTNTASTPKPAQTIRCGACWATIWRNLGPDGPFYSATVMRPFRDASGNWRNSTSFTERQLDDLMDAALKAKHWMAAHSRMI